METIEDERVEDFARGSEDNTDSYDVSGVRGSRGMDHVGYEAFFQDLFVI